MPTLSVQRDQLFKQLGVGPEYTEKDFDELCFDFGIELDEVTTEREIKAKSRAADVAEVEEANGHSKIRDDDVVIYKIDIPANRYDLLCIEGLVRALRVFKGQQDPPEYRLKEPEARQRMIVRSETSQIRPYVVCAVLRGIQWDQAAYNSFLDLQDQLHHNLCRRRTLVAIGTHDLDSIKGPFSYEARSPTDIVFKQLFETTERDAKEYMDYIRVHPEKKNNLGKYTDIIYDSPVYPVIYDSNRVVLSMPPIINGEHSKMSVNTKNIFIECTATDYTRAIITLNTMICMFSQYCAEPFTIEPVDVVYEDDHGGDFKGQKISTPDLSQTTFEARLSEVKNILGLAEIEPERVCNFARQMMLMEPRFDEAKKMIVVKAPPTRADILHECDVCEDIAVAYGFNNVVERLPPVMHTGAELPVMQLTELLRYEMAGAGYTEALTLGLCSIADAFAKLRRPGDGSGCVELSNPATKDFEIVRPTLLPGIIKTLKENRKNIKFNEGVKLFEISDVVFLDKSVDTGARNERHCAALYCGMTSGFEKIHGLVDRIFELLEVSPPASVVQASQTKADLVKQKMGGDAAGKAAGRTYFLKPIQEDTFFPGRAAAIMCTMEPGKEPVRLGSMGVLHPEVLQNFDLKHPCSVLELNIQGFV